MKLYKYIAIAWLQLISVVTMAQSTNLALNKPATASSYEYQDASYAVDGNYDLWDFWSGAPYAQWWQVDLQNEYFLNRIVVFTFYDGNRYYKYDVQGSLDGTTWSPLADFNNNTTPATAAGNTFNINNVKARYIRVNMNYNSANASVHIIEFEAYGSTSNPTGNDVTPPTTPTNLVAAPASLTSINLSWTASTDNTAVTGYSIYRDGTLLASTTSLSYTDNDVLPGSTHSYAIKSYDAAENQSELSQPASATTVALSANLALNKPATASSYEYHDASYAVDGNYDQWGFWSASPYTQWWQVDLQHEYLLNRIVVVTFYDGYRYYKYDIQGSLDGTNWSPLADFNNNTTPATAAGNSFNITNVKARYIRVNMNYNTANSAVHIIEFEAYGIISTGSITPGAPTNLLAVSTSGSQVNLTWADNSSNEDGFTIERRQGVTGSFETIATATANTTAYTDASTVASTTYTYRIAAKNATGVSTYTSEIEVTTPAYITRAQEAQYNGNISAVQWKVASASSDPQAGHQKEYDYYYDAMNRITASQYMNKTNATYNGTYDEGNYTYDPNGNLLSLKRSGFKSGVPEVIDDLTYSYGTTNTSNQLRTVSDAADKNFGFIDKNTTGDDYAYDANGNLTKDLNKGIDNITYNILNLPCKITSGSDSIVYTYDASGVKLCKKVYKAGALSLTIDYNGELEFYDNKLKMVHTEEGIARYDDVNLKFNYEYFLKDHLGNTRAVITLDATGNLSVLEATSYYAFGMAHNPMTPQNDNKYLYNGKERQDDVIGGVTLDWYDYRYRFYDPQIGRFNSIDRLAEKYTYKTPYDYAENNPITGIDLDGLELYPANLMQEWAHPGDAWLETKIKTGQKITPKDQSTAAAFNYAGNSGTLLGAKMLIYIAVGVVAPPVGISLAVSDLSGVPVMPAQSIAGTTTTVVEEAASEVKTSTSNIPSGTLFQPADLPNSAPVVRGGLCKSTNFENGSGVTVAQDGTLRGVSVNTQQGATVETLSSNIPNGKVGVTTAGDIRAAGGTASPSPSAGNPYHGTIDGLTSNVLERILNPVIPNPSK